MLQFFLLGYCLGLGRNQEIFWYWLASIKRMRYCTPAFLAGVMIWSQITDLPISLYSRFVIEARHGFSKQTIWLYFTDMLKGIILSILIGPAYCGCHYNYSKEKRSLLGHISLGIYVCSVLVMMTPYPVLVAPLFNNSLHFQMENLGRKLRILHCPSNFL